MVTPENLHSSVLVSSMLDSPISALYHSLQKVYSPLLLSDAKWSRDFDPKLQGLVTDLQSGLAAILRKKHGDSMLTIGGAGQLQEPDGSGSKDALATILAPTDESQYWSDMAKSAGRSDLKEMATLFGTALQPIANEFSKIGSIQLSDMDEVLEVCYNGLDDLWKLDEWVYPQKRMVHLMDTIAHSITRQIQSRCTDLDLWKSPFGQVEESLQQVHNIPLYTSICGWAHK